MVCTERAWGNCTTFWYLVCCLCPEYPGTRPDNGEAAEVQPEGSEASDGPTSSEIMTVEVHQQAEQQPAEGGAAAEQVFMYLQVSSAGFVLR